MEYMTPKEAAEQWGYHVDTVRKWCRQEKLVIILKAEKDSRGHWQIPANIECPKPIKNNIS